MHFKRNDWPLAVLFSTTLAACGGGGDSAQVPAPPPAPVVSTYSVAATVSGLNNGATLVLRLNAGDTRTITQNGSFGFATALSNEQSYNVQVATHPAGQVCTVTDGIGTIKAANVTSASVACVPATATIVVKGAQVTTFAGITGVPGANDGHRSSATFGCPFGVATDGSGGLYVADMVGQTIRRIAANGEVSTLAGSPLSGYRSRAMDGRGASATFNRPAGIAVDAYGNVYVADGQENEIRKITPDGTSTTFSDSFANNWQFNVPYGVATDRAGNLYVTDSRSHTIVKFTPNGFATTFAGQPYVAGATDGPAASALFNEPMGIAIDSAGTLYVTDSGNNTIRKITPDGVVGTLAGSAGNAGAEDGTGAAARFSLPSGIAVDALGTVFVVDTHNQLVRQVSPGGVVTTVAGTAGTPGAVDGYGADASFYDAYGIAVDAQGALYVGDCGNNAVRKIVPNGNATTTLDIQVPVEHVPSGIVTTLVAARGFGGSGYSALVLDSAGNIYDSGGTWLRKTAPDGVSVIFAGGPSGYVDGIGTDARFRWVGGMGIDSADNIYISDFNNLRKMTPAGVVSTVVAAGEFSFASPAFDAEGNMYISDSGYAVVRKIDSSGTATVIAGYGSDVALRSFDAVGKIARFESPHGPVRDQAGNLYVADLYNRTIRKISPAGVVTTVAGRPGFIGTRDGVANQALFHSPMHIAIDRHANLYVVDNATIRKITPTGVVTTVAGMPGQAGAVDGVGSAARFNRLGGLAVNADGVIYVADNGTVRKITQQ